MFGEKMREPLGPPTWTMCVATVPSGADDPTVASVAVCRLATADDVADMRRDSDAAIISVAAAKPIKAEAMTDLKKYILMCVDFSFELRR